MFSYAEMMRPGNCAMSAVAVIIGALLVTGPNPTLFLNPFSPIYISILVVVMITGAGNVINDYLDIESDKINRPDRPIPSGKVSKNAALVFCIMLFLGGIALSGFLTWWAFLIAVVNSAILVVYSKSLQNKILIGNIAVGYLVGSTFLFGGAALGNLTLPFLLMLLAMMSTVSREIVKDLEDLEGDRASFLKRLEKGAKKVGERFASGKKGAEVALEIRKAKIFAFVALLLSMAVSPLPYLMGILGWNYLIFLIPCLAVFSYCLYLVSTSSSKKDFARSSKLIKAGMNLGLLAFIAGVLL